MQAKSTLRADKGKGYCPQELIEKYYYTTK
jgi:hypothetical protein